MDIEDLELSKKKKQRITTTALTVFKGKEKHQRNKKQETKPKVSNTQKNNTTC